LIFHFIHSLYIHIVTRVTLDLSNYMFYLNASHQPAVTIKAAYSSVMLIHCYQSTKSHISGNSDFLFFVSSL